jgi:hypothetical protein
MEIYPFQGVCANRFFSFCPQDSDSPFNLCVITCPYYDYRKRYFPNAYHECHTGKAR